MLNLKISYPFYLTERTRHTAYTSIKLWQELEKTTRSSALLQLLVASTFIAECGQLLFRVRARIYIQLIVPRPLPPVRVCVRLRHGGRLEAG